MSSPVAVRALRTATRYSARSFTRRFNAAQFAAPLRTQTMPATRLLSTTAVRSAGLMPDSPDPKPPANEKSDLVPTEPTEISEDEYHEHADLYMNHLNEKAEAVQETREDVEVEFAAGVMSLTFPPNGTYVINKQPPNKQIWLSSPITGPKRFDWVVQGESMHEKEGGGAGDWIYLRDNTSLTELLRKELGITIDLHGEQESLDKQSTDPYE